METKKLEQKNTMSFNSLSSLGNMPTTKTRS